MKIKFCLVAVSALLMASFASPVHAGVEAETGITIKVPFVKIGFGFHLGAGCESRRPVCEEQPVYVVVPQQPAPQYYVSAPQPQPVVPQQPPQVAPAPAPCPAPAPQQYQQPAPPPVQPPVTQQRYYVPAPQPQPQYYVLQPAPQQYADQAQYVDQPRSQRVPTYYGGCEAPVGFRASVGLSFGGSDRGNYRQDQYYREGYRREVGWNRGSFYGSREQYRSWGNVRSPRQSYGRPCW